MNFSNDRYTLRLATPEDNEGIRQVYESGNFPGNLQVQFLRNPRPYESFLADGQEVRMMVINENHEKRIVGVGGAVIRREYVNGKETKNAYLTGLKIHPDYQKKILFLAQAYQFMGESLTDCDHCYTTILDDNAGAISMLEKKRKNMPTYFYLGHYMTFCFAGGKKCMKVSVQDRAMEEFLPRDTFTPVDTELKGLGKKKWYYATEDGQVVAACYVGDQKATKQYKVCGYGGILKLASKMPTKLLGYPAFPKEQSIVNHGVISYLYVKDNDEKLCRRFMRTVAKLAGFDLLIWGCFENHPLLSCFLKMKTVHYGSRLYEVDWNKAYEGKDKEEVLKEYKTLGVEVALL